jgi:hypothetical protein
MIRVTIVFASEYSSTKSLAAPDNFNCTTTRSASVSVESAAPTGVARRKPTTLPPSSVRTQQVSLRWCCCHIPQSHMKHFLPLGYCFVL